jgi:hypothetical protein
MGILPAVFALARRNGGCAWLNSIGALTAEHWRASGWQVMLRLAEKQSRIVADERPVLRFLTTLGELLTQGKLRLDPLRPKGGAAIVGAGLAPALGGADDAPLIYLGGAEGTLIGYHSLSYFHLLPSVSYNTVAKFARDEGRIFGTKAHMLWKALAEEGILDTDDGDHVAIKVYIEGEYRRLLRLHRAAVEKLWGLSPAKYGNIGNIEKVP